MKLGLGESYDNVSILPKKIRAYIDICQPASTLGAMGSTLLASLFFFYYTSSSGLIREEFSTIIYVVVTMGLAHAASQALNQAEDAEIDRHTPHKENRPIPSGIVTEEEARSIAWIMFALALGRGYIVNWMFGTFVTVILFLGVFYNLDPIRAKKRIVSVPWQAVSRGLLPYPAIWAAYGDITSVMPWILGVFMFFYVLGFQNTADYIDKKADEQFDISTLVVELGYKDTARVAMCCTGVMMIIVGSLVVTGVVGEWFLSMLLIIPFCWYMLWHMWYNPHRVSDITGNHPSYLWYYVGMVLCIAIPLSATYIVS